MEAGSTHLLGKGQQTLARGSFHQMSVPEIRQAPPTHTTLANLCQLLHLSGSPLQFLAQHLNPLLLSPQTRLVPCSTLSLSPHLCCFSTYPLPLLLHALLGALQLRFTLHTIETQRHTYSMYIVSLIWSILDRKFMYRASCNINTHIQYIRYTYIIIICMYLHMYVVLESKTAIFVCLDYLGI